jgi:hypothetical protein
MVPDLDVIETDPEKVIACDLDTYSMIERVHEIRREIKHLEAEETAHLERVQLTMGNAETLTLDGRTVATWKYNKDSTSAKTKELIAAAKKDPALAIYLTTKPGSRVFRLKENALND